jgi:hypothetical protein
VCLHDVVRICSRPTCHPASLSFLWPWKTNSGLIWLDWVAVSGSDSPARVSPSYWVTVLAPTRSPSPTVIPANTAKSTLAGTGCVCQICASFWKPSPVPDGLPPTVSGPRDWPDANAPVAVVRECHEGWVGDHGGLTAGGSGCRACCVRRVVSSR